MRVLIIGGYGNFGSFISKRLSVENYITVIVAGRSLNKAKSFALEINTEFAKLDIHDNFEERLQDIKPNLVIHTSGPFQSQGYDVARACIHFGAHYIDLADGREFVSGIDVLNEEAQAAGVIVVSGASSVPCLTSALADHYNSELKSLESLTYGISTAQKTTRGIATIAAILSYTGKSFKTITNGKERQLHGWQGIKARDFQGLGWRLLGYCNIPDLDLFPNRYPTLKTLKFYAGIELPFIHLALWLLSWLVRVGLITRLEKLAPVLLRISSWFNWLGTTESGFFMEIKGIDKLGQLKVVKFDLTAYDGDGPYIPCIPAILLAQKLANNELSELGAMSCIGLINKNDYLNALADLNITWTEVFL